MRLLMVGDIVGQPGRRIFRQRIRQLVREHDVDFVVANCENAAGGFGVTPEIAAELFEDGAGCLTSGNHIWKHRSIYTYIEEERRLLRPANFPAGTPGRGFGIYPAGETGLLIGVVNVMGCFGMDPLDHPFAAVDHLLEEVRAATPLILVDFHAEATAEKAAMAHFVDGRASLVVGTHTHVQTADERILPRGTGFLTDVGMTGPEESIIGVDKSKVVERFLTRMPVRFEVPSGPAILCAVLAQFDDRTGNTTSLRRLQVRETD